jgi:crotonobetainyl-CoA:carnitine CoA-transferase CaiB-like acyl-CoA transferase
MPEMPTSARPLPLRGVRVVEFTHMVMGPTCGMILGDLGAEVVKVEPIGGDNTRRLIGSGAGFFPMFNRNKMSIAVLAPVPVPADATIWIGPQFASEARKKRP